MLRCWGWVEAGGVLSDPIHFVDPNPGKPKHAYIFSRTVLLKEELCYRRKRLMAYS